MRDKLGNELPAIPAGHLVHPVFWKFRAQTELRMLLILAHSARTAVVDPITGRRKGKLAMQINPN